MEQKTQKKEIQKKAKKRNLRQFDLTEGPIIQKLLLFALPMMAGNMLQQIYNIADTIVVGRFIGPQALAAVGSAYTLMVFITSVVIGLCMGSGNLYSIRYGAGQMKELKKDIWMSFAFIALVTAVIYLIVFSSVDGIVRFMRVPEEIVPLIREYLVIIYVGIGFTSLYNFFAYVLRALGNSMQPFLFLVISSLINIILDLYFVIGLKLGIGGAALATVIAQAISGIGIAFYVWLKIPELRPKRGDIPLHSPRWREIMLNDLATSAQQSVMNFGILMIQGLVNSFGTTVMAAFAAAVKIDTFAYMPAQEFSNAFSLCISQNHGAGKKHRVKEAMMKATMTSSAFCLLVSAVIWFGAEQLMGIFVDGSETAIIAEGVCYLHIEGVTYIGIGILFLWYAYYRGIQRPHISLLLTIVSLGTRVALSYSLAPYTRWGVLVIWASIPIGWFLADLVGLLLARKNSVNIFINSCYSIREEY